MKKVVYVMLAVVLLASLCLAACAEKTTTPTLATPYKIGCTGVLSGPYSAAGIPCLEGLKAWVGKVNQNGGINGHQLELISLDDENDAARAVINFKKLVDVENVHVVFPGIMTPVHMAVRGLAGEMECVAIGPTGCAGPDRPVMEWYFRPGTCELNELISLHETFGEYGVKKIAALREPNAFADDCVAILNRWAKDNGYEVVAHEIYHAGDSDMTAQLSKIARANPDAIMLYGMELSGALSLKQARDMGLTQPVWVPAPLAGRENRTAIDPEYWDGVYCVQAYPGIAEQLPEDFPHKALCMEALELYQASDYYKQNPQPMADTFSGGYIAAQVLCDAIARTNTDPANVQETRAAIRDALEETDGFLAAFGKWTMSPDDHYGQRYGTFGAPCYFENGEPVIMVDKLWKYYDTEAPSLWYPWEWKSPTEPKE